MINPLIIKISATAASILIAVTAALGLLDHYGKVYTDESFERAIITFGVARGINGVISVAQGTEVAIHPAGFGINFTPGQILDPVNDLIEQFSWVMLASSASLGIQKIFLVVCSSWPVTALLILLMAPLLVVLWRPHMELPFVRPLSSMLLVLLFVRFSVPLAAIASEGFYQMFLSDQYQQATHKLEQTKETISSINTTLKPEPSDNILDKAKYWFDSAVDMVAVEKKMDAYTQAASDASRQAINLTAIFLIQTVIFPILFLWIVYRFLRNFSLFQK